MVATSRRTATRGRRIARSIRALAGRPAPGRRGQAMRPRKSTPPGERWTGREASAAITTTRPERQGPRAAMSKDFAAAVRWSGRHVCRARPPSPQRPDPPDRAGRATGARARPDVHLRTDRLPVRPRRQSAQLPAGRPHPPGAALPRAGGAARQERHGRRPPARRAARPRRRPDARPGRSRGPVAGRDRRRLRSRIPCRRSRDQHPAGARLPARDRAHRRHDPAGRGAPGRRPRLCDPGRQRLLRRRELSRLRPALGQRTGGPAGRPSWRRGARQARPGRLRPVEGRRRRAAAEMADPALGRRVPGLAPRVLGDVDALPRPALRHPHRRDRQRLPPPRGRDRPVHADRRRRAGPPLGPRRVPADGRPQDGQVGRQLPAHHRGRRARSRSARLPIPGADLPLRTQARLLGPIARRGGGRRSTRSAAGSGRSALPRPRVHGPPPPALVAGSAGDRPEGIAPRPGRPRRRRRVRGGRPRRRARGAAVARPAPPSTSASSRRSTTTSTCRPRSPWSARSCARASAQTSDAGSSSTPTWSSGSISTRPGTSRPATRCPTRSRSWRPNATRPAPAATSFDRTPSATELAGLGWEVVDGPGGSTLRRA